MLKILAAFGLLCILTSSHAFGLPDTLSLDAKKMSLGGSLSAPFSIDRQGRTKLEIIAEPRFSYFVTDNFELAPVFAWIVELPFATLTTHLPSTRLSLGAEGRYYFSLSNLHLYAGLGYRFSMAGVDVFRHHLRVPFGILMPLTNDLALEIGFPSEISFAPGYFDGLSLASLQLSFRYFFKSW